MSFADVDECEINNGGCEHTCTNQPGSFTCHCPTGLQLSSNGKTCVGKVQEFILNFILSSNLHLRSRFNEIFPSLWLLTKKSKRKMAKDVLEISVARSWRQNRFGEKIACAEYHEI